MSEKVKLPREVAEAIETLRSPSYGFSNYSIIGMMNEHLPDLKEVIVINSHMRQGKIHPDDLIAALVNDYEVEESPEDLVKRKYKSYSPSNDYGNCYRQAVRDTLNALGISIGGVNA